MRLCVFAPLYVRLGCDCVVRAWLRIASLDVIAIHDSLPYAILCEARLTWHETVAPKPYDSSLLMRAYPALLFFASKQKPILLALAVLLLRAEPLTIQWQ